MPSLIVKGLAGCIGGGCYGAASLFLSEILTFGGHGTEFIAVIASGPFASFGGNWLIGAIPFWALCGACVAMPASRLRQCTIVAAVFASLISIAWASRTAYASGEMYYLARCYRAQPVSILGVSIVVLGGYCALTFYALMPIWNQDARVQRTIKPNS